VDGTCVENEYALLAGVLVAAFGQAAFLISQNFPHFCTLQFRAVGRCTP
jgi:hypothetical protein